jgi:hypothetical protein
MVGWGPGEGGHPPAGSMGGNGSRNWIVLAPRSVCALELEANLLAALKLAFVQVGWQVSMLML